MKRKILSLIMVMIMSLSLVACSDSENVESTKSEETATPDEIVVGVMEDITGATGQQGTGAQKGIEMAAEEINASGGINGTTKIRLVSYDIKGDVTESINAYKRLCEEDGADIVIGPHISNIGRALAPLTETYKVPIVAAYLEDACVLSDNGPYRYVFMAQPSASQQATVMADYAMNDLGHKNFAVLYNSSNSYCTGLADPFMKYVEENGGTIVAAETFTDTDKDYRTQLTKIKASNPDAIYFPNYPAQVPLCVQQSRELGMTCDLLGSNSFIPNIYLTGEAGENNTYMPYNIDYSNEAIAEFNKKFEEAQGFETNAQVFIAMDALESIVAAFQKCGSTDSEALTDAMTQVTVKGWMGDFTYSAETHMPIGLPMCILNVVDGNPNTVKIGITT